MYMAVCDSLLKNILPICWQISPNNHYNTLWLSLSVPHFANLYFLYYSLNMTVDSFCLPNYYGDTCSTYCYPNTRYTCDHFGRKQCKHGILIDILLTQSCMLTIVWGLRLWRAEFYYDSRIQWCSHISPCTVRIPITTLWINEEFDGE